MHLIDDTKNDGALDFPFYNGIPKLSKFDWFVFILGPVLTVLLIFGVFFYIPGMEYVLTDFSIPILFCLVLLIPVAYVCKGNLGIFFKKPKLGDFKIIILCFIANTIFTIAMYLILTYLGFGLESSSATLAQPTSSFDTILLLIQLVGEELFKVSVLICVMAFIYHYTDNRKIAVVISTICTMIVFGLIHLESYDWNLVQCLLVIGLGAIFDLLPYLKTKNVVNSYILHVLIDIAPMILVF